MRQLAFLFILILLKFNITQASITPENTLDYAISLIDSRIEYNNRIIKFIESEDTDIDIKALEIDKIRGYQQIDKKNSLPFSKKGKEFFLNKIKKSIIDDNLAYDNAKKINRF